MRSFLILAAAGIGLLATAPANAADIRDRQVYTESKLQTAEPTPGFSWTGFYIGGAVGYANANHEVDVDFNDGEGSDFNFLNLNGLNSSGVVFNVNGGFDYQRDRIVIGALGGYTGGSVETTLSIGEGAFRTSLEKGDEWYVGGRIGVLPWQHTLIYVGAAYVETDYELRASAGGDSFTRNRDYSGVKALAGIETHLGAGIFGKMEYQHDFLDEVTWFNDRGTKVTDNADEDKILFGLLYKFGTGNLLDD